MNIIKQIFNGLFGHRVRERAPKQPTITILMMVKIDANKAQAEELLDKQCEELAFLNPKRTTISFKDVEDYKLIFKQYLPSLFDTDFVLVMQADGKVLPADIWSNEFFAYDYIGAPWMQPWIEKSLAGRGKDPKDLDLHVGSGKLSLRSRKLCEMVKERFETKPDKLVEDSSICLENRDFYVSQGAKFAPYEIATKFAVK